MKNNARYDEIADWYPGWVGDGGGLIADDSGGLLPRSIRGDRVLDGACGHGRAARGLARFGVDVVAVDISAGLIARARALEAAHALGISYRVADVAELDQWWDGAFFDGAVCEMAVMDIDDLHGMVDAVAATVSTGRLVRGLHGASWLCGHEAGLSSWPPERSYFHEGWWTSTDHNPEGVRLRVGSSHRTLSTYPNTVIDAGFTLERVVEPPAPVPTILVVGFRRGVPAPM